VNAIELIHNDHRRVEGLFAEFEADGGDRRQQLLGEIIRELSIHSAIEEAYIYPRIRSQAENGEAYVEESEREHQAVKESLARLDGKLDKAHTKEVADQVQTLKTNVMHHVEEEENEVLPAFEQAATKTELEEIGRELKAAKDNAPTRPHPNQPTATVLTGWANGLLDRARDAVAGRPR
jgi:iron-sulfur cluster repair protein YtfE (RIC family)